MTAAGARQLDTLELAALAYLLLPLAIFIATWLRLPVALGLGALLLLSCVAVLRHRRAVTDAPLTTRLRLLFGGVASVWVVLSGLIGPLPMNADWAVRMVVLRDLTVGGWPVSYGPLEGGEGLLRFSFAYYLVPALIGKLAGVGAARLAMALSTILGVSLFFALVAGAWPTRKLRAIAVLLLVLVVFSGMDIVGFVRDRGHLPAFAEHIEWWARWMQYSSQTTLLFWVPNHALPAWLAVGVLWRHRDSGLALTPAALLLLASALWSPLATLGLAPLLLWCSTRHRSPRTWLKEALQPPVLAVLPTTYFLAKFVTFGIPVWISSGAADAAWLQLSMTLALLPMLLHFGFIEWGALALVLAGAAGGVRRLPWYFWAAALCLLAMPLLRFGPGNDVVMRGGIAPMTLLMLITAATLMSDTTAWRWRLAVVALLLVGSVTPAMEVARATLPGSRWPDDGRSLAEHPGHPWHYVGVLGPGWMQSALRPPVLLPHGNDFATSPARPK